VLFIPSALFAQKMDKPLIDKFTNDTTLLTAKASIAKKDVGAYYQQLEPYFSKVHGEITLHLIVDLPQADADRFYINAGSAILLKLADNTLISVPSATDIKSITGEERGGFLNQGISTWTADIGLELSAADVKKLLTTAITAIRVPTNKSNMDFDISFNDAGILQRMILLIDAAK
jgi:hypothetical protein